MHARAFNVGSEQNNVTVAEIAETVAETVPGSELVITGEAGADPRSYRVDFARIRAALPEHQPRWTVKAGAVELADAYERHGLTRESFERRFTRLAWLSERRESGGSPRSCAHDRRGGDARAGAQALPDLPEHHRRRRAPHAGDHR
nr:hypothetical protein GCM10020093_083310 [Planobispora longispora]